MNINALSFVAIAVAVIVLGFVFGVAFARATGTRPLGPPRSACLHCGESCMEPERPSSIQRVVRPTLVGVVSLVGRVHDECHRVAVGAPARVEVKP